MFMARSRPLQPQARRNASSHTLSVIAVPFLRRWIARPWTSSEACPLAADQVPVAGTELVTLPEQTLAVAQFFARGAARQGRRDGQPFETSKRVRPDAFDRITGLPK